MNEKQASDDAALRQFADVLRGRRTIEQYLPQKIPDALVRDAIEAAGWAPNHRLTQPWKFYLLGPETISRCVDLIRTITTEKKDAAAGETRARSWAEKPGWLLVSCRVDGSELQQREDYAACAAAIQNLTLYLWKAGVGSKWTTGEITRDPRFFDIVGMGADETVVGLLWYGYPKFTPVQTRKPVDEILVELP